jgi:hypothetical protein
MQVIQSPRQFRPVPDPHDAWAGSDQFISSTGNRKINLACKQSLKQTKHEQYSKNDSR